MEFMEINGKIYVFKFGLKGLILLSKLPKIDVEKNFKYVVFAGLLSDNPNITLPEVEALISEMNEESLAITIASVLMNSNLKEDLKNNLYKMNFGTEDEINKLYEII